MMDAPSTCEIHVRVQCSNCAKFLRVGPALAGRLVACPGCKSKLRVPARSDKDEAIVPAKQLPKPAPPEPSKASPVKAPGPDIANRRPQARAKATTRNARRGGRGNARTTTTRATTYPLAKPILAQPVRAIVAAIPFATGWQLHLAVRRLRVQAPLRLAPERP